MSLPTANDLGTLDFAYEGVPFVQVESKVGQNTNSLDFVYNGVPFVGAKQYVAPTGLTPTRMFLIF
jgi:hypothetical protein